jgi:putrescine transport system substrate-binding protein
MKAKTIFAAALFAASAAGLAAPATARAEGLYLYTWADFFPEQVLKDFTKETGIEVTQTNYDSVVIPETKLMAGASGFDVVLTAGFTTPRLIQAGVLKELDHGKLPNIGNIDPDFAKRQMAMTDPGMQYTIPLDFGVTTIVYNADKVKRILGPNAPTDSLALLFDPANAEKLQSCGISMLDSAADTMNAALLYVGVKDVYRPTDGDLKRAAAALKAIRPYVRYYDNVRYAQDLGSGDICVALGWNFDAVRVAQNAADTGHPIDLKVMMPKQGMAGWSDRLVVPKDAPHGDAALAFINFLMKGESAAAFTQNSLIATPNSKAAAFLDPKLKDNPGIFPPADRLSSILPDFTYSPKVERDNTRYFTAVKTGN